jgi:hypothetical protein
MWVDLSEERTLLLVCLIWFRQGRILERERGFWGVGSRLAAVFDIASALRSSDILEFGQLFTYISFTALIGCGISGANGCSWIHSITPFGLEKTHELDIHVSLSILRGSRCRLVCARTGKRGCRCVTSILCSSSVYFSSYFT